MWVLFLSAVGLSVGSHPPALLAHPWVMTGGCASITACDSVDIIGDLLVPLKLFSVRVVFFFLTCRQLSSQLSSSHIMWKGALSTLVTLRHAVLLWQYPVLRNGVIVLYPVSWLLPSSSIFLFVSKEYSHNGRDCWGGKRQAHCRTAHSTGFRIIIPII